MCKYTVRVYVGTYAERQKDYILYPKATPYSRVAALRDKGNDAGSRRAPRSYFKSGKDQQLRSLARNDQC